MEVVVTSGGTIARIDDVRHVGNFSQGTTGALIAEEFLRRGATVHYVYGKRAKRPFRGALAIDPARPLDQELARAAEAYRACQQYAALLREYPFETFAEYYEAVRNLLAARAIDAVILAAAVSDYGPSARLGKISSEQDTLSLELVKYPKVIGLVKQWNPHVFQVGFKLLANAELDELVEVAYRHGLEHHSDLTVANTVRGGEFRKRLTVIITPEKGLTPAPLAALPARLADLVYQRVSRRHYRTEVDVATAYRTGLSDEIGRFRRAVARLWKLNLFEPYYESASQHFGFLAQRVARGGFLITARGSNKEAMPVEEVVYVAGIDFAERVLRVQGRKASLNANVAGRIFAEHPEVALILHAHVFPGVDRRTGVAYAPGTEEDVEETLRHLGSGKVLELADHGILAVGSDLEEVVVALDTEPAYTKFAEVYDLIYARFHRSDDFLRLVQHTVRSEQSVLDLAGGTGALTSRLLASGYREVALADKHEAMLVVARRGLPGTPCYRADMKELVLPKQFDAILVRQAINYLMSCEGLVAGLKQIHRCLNAQGILIFNGPNYHQGLEYDSRQLLYEVADYFVKVREMNAVEGRTLIHTQHCILYRQDGSEIRRVYDMNRFGLFTEAEFRSAAREAGFSSIEFYGKGLGQLTAESRSLYAVAKA
jgi:phosphopantothenate-cysteine ligase